MNKYARITETTEDDFDKARSSNVTLGRDLQRREDNPIANILNGLVGDLSKKQARNIKSVGIGGGTAAIHNVLSPHIGDTLGAIVGLGISLWVTKKLVRSRE